MSKGESRTKKISVTIPTVSLDGMFGPRQEGNNVSSLDRSLERKQKKIKELETDIEQLDLEGEIEERKKRLQVLRDGTPVVVQSSGEDQGDTLSKKVGDRLIEEVVIPAARSKLLEKNNESGSTESARALKVAERALDLAGKGPKEAAPKSTLEVVDQAIDLVDKLESRIRGGGKEEPPETEKGLKELDILDRAIDVAKKLDAWRGGHGGGDREDQKLLLEHKKWEKQFERDEKIRDRAYALQIRKQDQDHRRDLAKLGIEKDRNDMLKDVTKRIGKVIAESLLEEEELEEEEEGEAPPSRPKGKTLWKGKCPKCGADITVPPEAQVLGREIKCTKCGAVSEWTEEGDA